MGVLRRGGEAALQPGRNGGLVFCEETAGGRLGVEALRIKARDRLGCRLFW